MAEELKNKYKVPSLPTPGYSYRKYKPVEILPHPPPNKFPEELPDTQADAMKAVLANRKLRTENFIIDDRYIDLRIDLTYPVPELRKAFEEKIKEWRKSISRLNKSGRIRKNILNHWAIYRLHEFLNKTFMQITGDLFKVEIPARPSDDLRVFRLYEQVRYAYLKAKAMIKQVTPR